MAQDYSFTFQNLNPTSTGWTGGSIQQTLADLRNTPFDPLDKSEVIDDTTAGAPNGGAGVEVLNLAQGRGMLKSVDQVIKNLQKASKRAPDLDTLKYYNEQLLEAQKERDRIQGEVIKFGGTAGGKKHGGGGSSPFPPGSPENLLGIGGKSAGAKDFLFPGLGGLFGSDKPLTPAQRAELLTKKVANADSKLDVAQDQLDAHQHSIDSLQAAIDKTTDPKAIGHLQKQLMAEQKKLSNMQSKFDAQKAHRTELQDRLVKVNASLPTAPAATTPGTTPAPATTPAGAATKAPNYWDELVDKALGTRAGVSGWHSGYIPPAVTPTVVTPATVPPIVEPATTPAVTTPIGTPVPLPTTPVDSVTGIPTTPTLAPTAPVLNARQLRRQQRRAARTTADSGWTSAANTVMGPLPPVL